MKRYIQSIKRELSKITFPTKKQIRIKYIIIVIVCIIMIGLVGIGDRIGSSVFQFLLTLD